MKSFLAVLALASLDLAQSNIIPHSAQLNPSYFGVGETVVWNHLDPIPTIPKPSVPCALEGGYCSCQGLIRYGVGDRWLERVNIDPGDVRCWLRSFNFAGSADPAPGMTKSCFCFETSSHHHGLHPDESQDETYHKNKEVMATFPPPLSAHTTLVSGMGTFTVTASTERTSGRAGWNLFDATCQWRGTSDSNWQTDDATYCTETNKGCPDGATNLYIQSPSDPDGLPVDGYGGQWAALEMPVNVHASRYRIAGDAGAWRLYGREAVDGKWFLLDDRNVTGNAGTQDPRVYDITSSSPITGLAVRISQSNPTDDGAHGRLSLHCLQLLDATIIKGPLDRTTVSVGGSGTNTKTIDAQGIHYCASNAGDKGNRVNQDYPNANDKFLVTVPEPGKVVVKRLDSNAGWGMNLAMNCVGEKILDNLPFLGKAGSTACPAGTESVSKAECFDVTTSLVKETPIKLTINKLLDASWYNGIPKGCSYRQSQVITREAYWKESPDPESDDEVSESEDELDLSLYKPVCKKIHHMGEMHVLVYDNNEKDPMCQRATAIKSMDGSGQVPNTVTCCDSAGKGSRPGCVKDVDWQTARAHCQENGLDLCSYKQIEEGSGYGSGCQFSDSPNWVLDSCEQSLDCPPTTGKHATTCLEQDKIYKDKDEALKACKAHYECGAVVQTGGFLTGWHLRRKTDPPSTKYDPETVVVPVYKPGQEPERSAISINASSVCLRPTPWCNHKGSTYVLQDCDGDGIDDPTCSDTKGHFGVIQSSVSCTDSWPSGVCARYRIQKTYVFVGGSATATKTIDAPGIHFCAPNAGDEGFRINEDHPNAQDEFIITVPEPGKVVVTRTDAAKGWGLQLAIICDRHIPFDKRGGNTDARGLGTGEMIAHHDLSYCTPSEISYEGGSGRHPLWKDDYFYCDEKKEDCTIWNVAYATLDEAWGVCGITKGCTRILKNTMSKVYFMRKASHKRMTIKRAGWVYMNLECPGTCSDGIMNGGEQKVDCGGPCSPCPTCQDGKRNQGEQGVDCGGPCHNRCYKVLGTGWCRPADPFKRRDKKSAQDCQRHCDDFPQCRAYSFHDGKCAVYGTAPTDFSGSTNNYHNCVAKLQ